MPRVARRNRPGLAYHVIWRFVDRNWYFGDDEERAQYLWLLGRALMATDWRCIAYALMSSHVHLYLIAGRSPMSEWAKRAHPYFALWMNRRHQRLGSLFANRPTDHAFLPRNEPNLLAYVHNNPVRAGVVQHAKDSTWTSHRAYVGLAHAPPWLFVDEGLTRTGLADTDLNEWIASTPGTRRDIELDAQRRAVRKLGAIRLATPLSDGDHTSVSLVSRPYAHVRVPPNRVVEVVASLMGIDLLQICSSHRRSPLPACRSVVARVGHALGLSKSQLAAAVGMSAEGVHRAGLRQLSADDERMVETAMEWLRLEFTRTS